MSRRLRCLWVMVPGLLVLCAVGCSSGRGCLGRSRSLRIAAGTQGSVVYELGTALTEVFNAHVEGVRTRVVEGGQARDSLKTLLAGGADLAIAFSDSEGDGDVRTLVPLYELYLYMVVWQDQGIRDVPGLRGKRVALGPDGSGTDAVARRLFAHYGLSASDLTLSNQSYRVATNRFLKRELDSVFILGSIESAAVEQMLKAPGVELLSLDDPEHVAPAMEGIRTKHPFVLSHVIPKHLFGDQPHKPTGVIGVNALLVARSDLSDEIARELTRVVFQRRLELGSKVARLRDLTETFDPQALRFPLHPGASQYYRRDEPPAITKWAETISLLITVVLLVWSALMALLARRRRKRKNLLDALYQDFQQVVHSYDEEHETPPDQMTDAELQQIREKLQGLRRRSFEALMRGTVEADNAFVVFSDYLRWELQEIERIQRSRRGTEAAAEGE